MRSRTYEDKVVVITGAAGGIGTAMAHAFGDAGAKLVLLDLDEERLRTLQHQLDGFGIPSTIAACDVTQLGACQHARRVAVDAFGSVDVVVANAGISHRSLFAATDPEVLHKVMEVNFFGAVNLTHAFLDDVKQQRGQIIAVSSVAGFAPLVGRTGYAASKHALHGFFDSLRSELKGTGVDVMVVCPAFTDTALAQNALTGEGEQVGGSQSRNTAGGTMTPADVAAAVVDAGRQRRRLVPISKVAKGSLWLSRLFPRLYERVMLREQGSEFTA